MAAIPIHNNVKNVTNLPDSAKSKLRILHIEDSEIEALMVNETLTLDHESEFDIENATTINKALAKLKRNLYDVIILDLTLPDCQGLESLNQIRSANQSVPIIVLTCSDDTEITDRIIQYGAQDFIHKEEYTIKLLHRCIRYAIERKKKELELQQIVQSDGLTQLSNRLVFMDRLERSLLSRQRKHDDKHVVVMLLDLDNFKVINDNHGHGIGDALLIQVANRLKSSIRKSDTLARLGGDEFTVLLDEINDLEAIGKITNKIINSLSAPFIIDNKPIFTSCSIGVSSTIDTDSHTAEILLKNADIAMYNAKKKGGNQVRFFTKDLQLVVEVRNNLDRNLRRAIEKNELKVYFQPQIDIVTKKLAGAEALVRWQHPELGIITPDTFIPILEETGLIITATDWVIEESLRTWQQLQHQGLIGSREHISINLSPRYFRHQNYCSELESICNQFEIKPENIVFELTENILIDVGQHNLNCLQNLNDMGFKIAIDDFGTGYSSLMYLKAFNVDCLKLDRLFIADIMSCEKDRILADAIITLCAKLGIQLIAEGVSEKETLQLLKGMNCRLVQGYYFSQPLGLKDFTQFLQQIKKSGIDVD